MSAAPCIASCSRVPSQTWGSSIGPSTFLSRRWYGSYLVDMGAS